MESVSPALQHFPPFPECMRTTTRIQFCCTACWVDISLFSPPHSKGWRSIVVKAWHQSCLFLLAVLWSENDDEVCSFCGVENSLCVEQQCHGGGFMGSNHSPARPFSALQLPWRFHNRAQWAGGARLGGA